MLAPSSLTRPAHHGVRLCCHKDGLYILDALGHSLAQDPGLGWPAPRHPLLPNRGRLSRVFLCAGQHGYSFPAHSAGHIRSTALINFRGPVDYGWWPFRLCQGNLAGQSHQLWGPAWRHPPFGAESPLPAQAAQDDTQAGF